MLRELRIKDFAIIDDLTISFGGGFIALTGETGAGKSIIVDALGLLLGEKATQDLIKTGAAEARVEATFDPAAIPALEELGIEATDSIIVRRILSAKGKGRAYINDTAVSLQTLATVSRELVDIHGQHEHQGLLKKESHLSFLDSYAGLTEEALELQVMYGSVSELREKLSAINSRIRERSQRIDLLKYQITEIDSAALKSGDKASLEEERGVLANAAKLKESAEAAYSMLYGAEGAICERLSQAAAYVRDMAKIDRNAQEAMSTLQNALPLVDDVSAALRRLKDTYDIDPARLTEVEDRLDLIKKLEKKYGEGIDNILAYRQKADEELAALEHAEEEKEGLEKELLTRESALMEAGAILSGKRKAAAPAMAEAVMSELRELGFQKALFEADFKERAEVSAAGLDDVEFLFSANPGEPARPLIKVASGGELSRIMLSLKCIEITRMTPAADAQSVKTLIFDEVDSGIGGVTAQHVGARLASISANYQVICITHLPQIAARAGYHLMVEKELSQSDVKVRVALMSPEKRQHELARMLGGTITEKSLQHAEEMLAGESNR